MEINDIIGSIGVTMMLFGFVLNIVDKLDNDNIFYILLNLFGGILACIASILIKYTPFIILEATWVLVSGWGIYDYIIKKRNEIK
jgi:hypothetical protein